MAEPTENELDAPVFADILRSADHPQWQQAYDTLVRIFRQEVARAPQAPRVREAGPGPVADVATGLAHEFWLRIQRRPLFLKATAVQSWGVVRYEIKKFLYSLDVDAQASPVTAPYRMRRHFESKLRRILRANYQQPLTAAVWGRPGLPPREATLDEIANAREVQPALIANWEPQQKHTEVDNPGKKAVRPLPPIAAEADLSAHLEKLFDLLGAHASFHTLADLCWMALKPPLAAEIASVEAGAGKQVDTAPSPDDIRDFRLNDLLQRHFQQQDAQTQAVARQKFAGLALRQMNDGTSKSSAARKLKQYYDSVGALLREAGYADDSATVMRALRDILGG